MKAEDTIDFHIRWAWAKMNRAYNSEASRYGATMAMGYTLLNIDPEGTPSTSLGPRMGIERTSLPRLLNTLENEGYIRRTGHKVDGRVVLVHLTPKGKKFRDVTKQKVAELNDRIQGIIPKKKLQVFFEVMGMINDVLDNEEIFKKGKK